MVYLNPSISINSSIQLGFTVLKILKKLYFVVPDGSFLNTKHTSAAIFYFILFSMIRYISHDGPIKSFWIEVDRLKYAKDDEISSWNFIIIDGFPL